MAGNWKCEELKVRYGKPYCRYYTYLPNPQMHISESLQGDRPLHLVLRGKHMERAGDSVETLMQWVEAVSELGK